MDHNSAMSNVQDLSDLELAMLLSLISSHHSIIQTDPSALDDLEAELQFAARQTFGLSCVSMHCTPGISLDEFTQNLLVQNLPLDHSLDYSSSDGSKIPNVIVIRDLQTTTRTIQMQAMELLKSKRIFTHTAVHSAPKHFLVLLISATGTPALVNHLRDFIYLSHTHDPADGFPNMMDASESSLDKQADLKPLFSTVDVDGLTAMADKVTISVEVMRYIHDIAVFLRMHRAVAAGTTPLATRYLVTMCKSLACLHDMRYVTPSLVGLATKKVFRHRLAFVTPSTERSMQYGSDVASVAAFLKDSSPESVIENVLASVECPL